MPELLEPRPLLLQLLPFAKSIEIFPPILSAIIHFLFSGNIIIDCGGALFVIKGTLFVVANACIEADLKGSFSPFGMSKDWVCKKLYLN